MIATKAKDVDSSYQNRSIFFNTEDQAEMVRILEFRLIELFQPSLYSFKERIYHIQIALDLVSKFRHLKTGQMCGAEFIYRHYAVEFEDLKDSIALIKRLISERKQRQNARA